MRLTVGIHPVREALRAGRPLDKVLIAKGAASPRIQEIIDLCRKNAVPVHFEPRELLDRTSKGVSHQGVVAFGAVRSYIDLKDVVDGAQLIVVLDGFRQFDIATNSTQSNHTLVRNAFAGAVEQLARLKANGH